MRRREKCPDTEPPTKTKRYYVAEKLVDYPRSTDRFISFEDGTIIAQPDLSTPNNLVGRLLRVNM